MNNHSGTAYGGPMHGKQVHDFCGQYMGHYQWHKSIGEGFVWHEPVGLTHKESSQFTKRELLDLRDAAYSVYAEVELTDRIERMLCDE